MPLRGTVGFDDLGSPRILAGFEQRKCTAQVVDAFVGRMGT